MTRVLLTSCGNSSSNSSYEQSWEEDANVGVEDQMVECEQCGGDGRLSRNCPTCKGSGRLVRTISETKTRSCSSCYGIGLAPCNNCGNNGYHGCTDCYMGSRQCTSCNGAGVIYLYGDFYKCNVCNETGYVTCSTYNGDGKITCGACNGRGNIKCSACNGTGGPTISNTERYDQGECPTCDGEGKVYDGCFVCDGEGKIEV